MARLRTLLLPGGLPAATTLSALFIVMPEDQRIQYTLHDKAIEALYQLLLHLEPIAPEPVEAAE